jgi:hypothetical protein
MDAQSRLMVSGAHGGLARFEGDTYQLRNSGPDLAGAGNPWLLCSLWLAQYQLLCAKELGDLELPLTILEKVSGAALPSGVLAEQIDPPVGRASGGDAAHLGARDGRTDGARISPHQGSPYSSLLDRPDQSLPVLPLLSMTPEMRRVGDE